jgi:regulator of replication initiation timing
MEKRLEEFGNSIRTIGRSNSEQINKSNAEEMKEVYEELLSKCEKYSKTISKLKSYMGKITKEYDGNIELLMQKLEKQKNDPKVKETIQKYNKKILAYKLKIRDLQENVAALEEENSELQAENSRLKNQTENDTTFKTKIKLLKSEYESKMKEIMDEVKGKFLA